MTISQRQKQAASQLLYVLETDFDNVLDDNPGLTDQEIEEVKAVVIGNLARHLFA